MRYKATPGLPSGKARLEGGRGLGGPGRGARGCGGTRDRRAASLHGSVTGGVAAERQAPVLLQDGAHLSFAGAARSGIPRLWPALAQAHGAAGVIEGPFELGPSWVGIERVLAEPHE